MDEDEWVYESIMSEEINMNENREEKPIMVGWKYWLFWCLQYFLGIDMVFYLVKVSK